MIQAYPETSSVEPEQSGVNAAGLFERFAPGLLVLYSFVAALSIAASQIVVVALTLLWIFQASKSAQPELEKRMIAAIGFFLLAALIAAALGLDPARALVETLKLSFGFLFPFAVAATLDPKLVSTRALSTRFEHLLFGFCLGHFLAGIHSISSAYRGAELPIGIPGAVTESGQLVLVLTMLVCFTLSCPASTSNAVKARTWLITAFLVLLAGIIAWPATISSERGSNLHLTVYAALLGISLLGLLLARSNVRAGTSVSKTLLYLRPLLLGVLIAAFFINLKRGPWLGLATALILFGSLYSKQLVISCLGIAAVAIGFVQPIQNRILALSTHFSIAGGRQSMWEIGLELIQRYPLGLGLDNARFMRVVDPSLPFLHRHMHNNLLNVAVETGFFGLLCYLWWFYLLYRITLHTFRSPVFTQEAQLRMITAALLCALLGWQVSGLVEYNFGDGEIRLIAFAFIGVLLALHRHSETPACQNAN